MHSSSSSTTTIRPLPTLGVGDLVTDGRRELIVVGFGDDRLAVPQTHVSTAKRGARIVYVKPTEPVSWRVPTNGSPVWEDTLTIIQAAQGDLLAA